MNLGKESKGRMKTPKEKADELYIKLGKENSLLVVEEVKEVLKRNRGFTQCLIDLDYWKKVETILQFSDSHK